jgi:four helix bundle protein
MSDFRKLLVYQKARALAKRMVQFYPRIRKRSRRLADQLERSVESIGDAIAEGRGRATDRDFAGFATTAISSANETEHHLLRCFDYGILLEGEHESLTADVIEVRKMLIGLRRTLRGS